jgi:hypothetical protein
MAWDAAMQSLVRGWRGKYALPMRGQKKKATAEKLRAWRASLLRSRAIPLGTVHAPDEKAAEALAAEQFGLDEEQRKRLVVSERD